MAWPSDLNRTKNWGTEILTDSDLEAQLDLIINWVKAAFDASTGHAHEATSNKSKKIDALYGLSITSQAQGDILYASSAIAFARLGAGTKGQCLTTGGAAANPSWLGMTTTGDIEYHDGTSRARLAKGSDGQFLKLASGFPSWAAAPTADIQTFTASGTWTKPSTGSRVLIQCWGGGGSGGNLNGGSGGGGGGGSYVQRWMDFSAISGNQTVTIGAGGTGVTGAVGNVGGNTTFGAHVTAYGGGGGGGNSNSCGGGGGGGRLSVGSVGGAAGSGSVAGGNGGSPGGAGAPNGTTAAGNSSQGGGGGGGVTSGSAASVGGDSAEGGAGGGAASQSGGFNSAGGNSFIGGAGGGAGNSPGNGSAAGGTSVIGGNGGAGSAGGAGTAGSQPGGGGGGCGGTSASGAGGAGKCVVTTFP